LLIWLSGGAIGAGLFVGTGSAFQTGGPAAVLLGFIIIGKLVFGSDTIANALNRFHDVSC
jgi:amino acid permease